MKKILLLTIPLLLLLSCEKSGIDEQPIDNEFLKLAYDKNYINPIGFYADPTLPTDNVYYMNTMSVSPQNNRSSTWIELSTNDKSEATEWLSLTLENSNSDYAIIDESENEKYFEFRCKETTHSYITRFRVHKTSYYQSVFDRRQPWHHINETLYGTYNGAASKEKVKECIEYLWSQSTFANLNHKVYSSTINETNDYFEVHILSLSMTYGDWGLKDMLSVCDNYIRFYKSNKSISFKQTVREQIPGLQR